MKTYILGGVPRSGKSYVQKLMLERHNVPGFTTDLLRDAFEIGVPTFGINSEQSDLEKSHTLWPYWRGILKARKHYDDEILIEGTNFLPEYLAEFKTRDDIIICFLGYAEINIEEKLKQIRSFHSQDNWTDEVSDNDLKEDIKLWISQSKELKEECARLGLNYIDTSFDLEQKMDEVISFLKK